MGSGVNNMKKIKRNRRHQVSRYNRHIDTDWILSKVGDGSSGYVYYTSARHGIAYIRYIYGVNKVRVYYYNIILYLRYIKRSIAYVFEKVF